MLISAVALNKAGSALLGLFRKTTAAGQEPETAGESKDCIIKTAARTLVWSKALRGRVIKSDLWVEKLDECG